MGGFLKRLSAYLHDALGARVTVAIAALALVAFLAHAVNAPGRLPPVGAIGLQELGFIAAPPAPPPLQLPDFLDAATQAQLRQSLRDTAATKAQSGAEVARAYLAANPNAVGILNWVGFAASLALLLAGIAAMARRQQATL